MAAETQKPPPPKYCNHLSAALFAKLSADAVKAADAPRRGTGRRILWKLRYENRKRIPLHHISSPLAEADQLLHATSRSTIIAVSSKLRSWIEERRALGSRMRRRLMAYLRTSSAEANANRPPPPPTVGDEGDGAAGGE